MTMSKMGPFAHTTMLGRYSHDLPGGGKESWEDIGLRVPVGVFSAIPGIDSDIVDDAVRYVQRRAIMPAGRYLYATGRPFHQTNNCMLFRVEDSREGWAELKYKAFMALMTGAGIGGYYGAVRGANEIIARTGGLASGPLALMRSVNEDGREVMQGGSRRAAVWAGLPWWHSDIFDFIRLKDWSPEVRALKEKDFNFPAPMDMTNISVCLDDEFFDAYFDHGNPQHKHAQNVYWTVIKRMRKTGEPGFSINCGENWNEVLRNACTEITSEDDSDVCNLAHGVLPRVKDLDEWAKIVRTTTAFCLAGSVYSDVPFEGVKVVREKNRRLGVGHMGMHEWLMRRGKPYGEDSELEDWFRIYEEVTEETADELSAEWGLSRPVKLRAIAPTGTTGIVAETTTGIEPMICAAYKRRYLEQGTKWKYQYVVDPVARRMVDDFGVDPNDLEDAYTLAEDPERRISTQAWAQQFVDHGISSTLNLPSWGSKHNNEGHIEEFGTMLLRYLPKLRGITTYPDGSRGGQPITTIRYEEAVKHEGEIFEESIDICDLTGGSSCGD